MRFTLATNGSNGLVELSIRYKREIESAAQARKPIVYPYFGLKLPNDKENDRCGCLTFNKFFLSVHCRQLHIISYII